MSENDTILVTCYVNPDLDGVAGSMAYAEFLGKTGHNVVAGIIGKVHEEAKYVLDRFHIQYPKELSDGKDFDQIILVDASDLNGIEGKFSPEKVIEIIDHRKIHEADKFPNAKVQIELVGAAATLVAEKFMEENLDISIGSAILLNAAIISNTSNFRGSVTTERDKNAAFWLNKTAKLEENFWEELFKGKSDLGGSKLEERIEGDFAWFEFGNKKLGIAQIEMIGGEKLIQERGEEIWSILEKIKHTMNLDFIFQNTIDLKECKNIFVTNDEPTQKLLEKVLNIQFGGMSAEKPNITMRKQLVPLLKAGLESL